MEEDDTSFKSLCSRLTLQSDKQGFFNNLVESLQRCISITAFSKCTTDLERIKFCTEHYWDLIGAELIFKGKTLDEAVTKRLDGNKAFEKGDLKNALLYYSQSIVRCPVGIELAHAYSNRSALLHKVGEFEPAITDVELAISYGSPDNTRHKLYERMASCHYSLKNHQKAKVTLKLAKHLADQHVPNDTKFFKKLDKLSSSIEKAIESDLKNEIEPNTVKPTTVSDEETNTVFPGTTPKLDVKYSPNLGRFSYTKQEIFTGEEILRENPFAACLLPERAGSYCLHCFARLKTPIACETCAHVGFCSKQCRQNAEPYHRYECRILALFIGSGMSANCHLALRIITQTSAAKLLETISTLQSKPEEIILNADGKYDATAYQNVFNLGALETMRNPQDFLERTIMAVFLMKCLRLVGYYDINLFKNPNPTNEELQIGSLILRNLQVLPFNAYEVSEFVMEAKENFRTSKAWHIGLAVYPTAAFFNHSCAPNITRYFIGKTMVAASIRRIASGEPIQDNYGPIFTKMERKERIRKLSGRYWFKCSCDACTDDWPMLVTLPQEIEGKNQEEMKVLKRLHNLEEKYFTKALQAMDVGKSVISIELLKKYLDESHALLFIINNSDWRPYKTVLLAQEALKLCLCTKGTIVIATVPK